MANSSSTRNRRRRNQPGFGAKARSILIGPVGALLVIGGLGGALWWQNRPQHVEFTPETAAGQEALNQVETFTDLGRTHVTPGQPVNYDSDFPTSGPHDPTPVSPGFYSEPQRPEMLVHSLEHGNIVVYYDQPGEEAIQTLQSWVRQFSGPWDGLVAVPRPGLGEEVVLTAWTKKLVTPEFDPAASATFIDEFRGRGPENPVR